MAEKSDTENETRNRFVAHKRSVVRKPSYRSSKDQANMWRDYQKRDIRSSDIEFQHPHQRTFRISEKPYERPPRKKVK
ncbi:hypothetical protein F1737_02660 [Methanoplanus sp. FWC-SCC4]|uniref:Uncharacterized protein n=1 Tax=Methanochimaera problematica TaxID=2609417 RepID=A0AA97FCF5_9EURY|nr:hypothetical protein [Methanoplanus sp. FWC-SCC4]WOF15664.1 hypothetical protein F1737_02660 [Methanoplanus sp. FWC-SCC4]